MQDKVTYHSSAILYNDMFVEVARAAADKVEDPKVKKWCVGIAKQHEFHAQRHRSALEKVQRKAEHSTDSSTVGAPVPATSSAQASSPESMEVEVDVDLSKENKA